MGFRACLLASVALVLAGCISTPPDRALGVEDQQLQRLVTVCGAGMRRTVATRLVLEITRQSGEVGPQFEEEFKAAIPFTGERAVDLYKEFLLCIERERSAYMAPVPEIFSSKELTQRVVVLNPRYQSKRHFNFLSPDDISYTYELIIENQNNLPVMCRVNTEALSTSSHPSCKPYAEHLWSERKDILLGPGRASTITGSKTVSEASRCWSDVRFRSKVIACWRQ